MQVTYISICIKQKVSFKKTFKLKKNKRILIIKVSKI